MTNVSRVSLLLTVLFIPSPPASGGARLDLRISPPVSFEPAYVTVRVTVEADPENRTLEVVAETPEFRRSSQISLDGERAPRLNVFEFRALPTGVYEVTGTLVRSNGARARIARTLVVISSRSGARRR